MKSIHLSACWGILHALDLSEEYEGRPFPRFCRYEALYR